MDSKYLMILKQGEGVTLKERHKRIFSVEIIEWGFTCKNYNTWTITTEGSNRSAGLSKFMWIFVLYFRRDPTMHIKKDGPIASHLWRKDRTQYVLDRSKYFREWTMNIENDGFFGYV